MMVAGYEHEGFVIPERRSQKIISGSKQEAMRKTKT